MGAVELRSLMAGFAAIPARDTFLLQAYIGHSSGGWELEVSMIGSREWATTFALQPAKFCWFLGAGASAGAGVPTAYHMTLDFKTELFCRGTGLSRRQVDAGDPIWIERIEDFLARQNVLPPSGDPTEYARAFEAVYPLATDRRAYIAKQVAIGRPGFAHRVLGSLIVSGRTPCVFTTNFDHLVETASTLAADRFDDRDRASLTVAAIDDATRAERCLAENDWPLLAKIHGDFQSTELKNTDEELRSQDAQIRGVLVESCTRFGLIVVGYSGRDASVMDALHDVLRQPSPFPGGLFWATRTPGDVLPRVRDLIVDAQNMGVRACLVESPSFDELAAEMSDALSLPTVLQTFIENAKPAPLVIEQPLPDREFSRFPILRLSALKIMSLPTVARSIQLRVPTSLSDVRRHIKEARAKISIASQGKDFVAFGLDAHILSALAPFEPRLNGTASLTPEDSWALGLIYDVLVRALCRGRPLLPRLRHKGHSVLVANGRPDEETEHALRRVQALAPLQDAYSGAGLYGVVPRLGFPFKEGVKIRIEQTAGAWWCVFEPFTDVEFPASGDEVGESFEGEGDATAGYRGQVASWVRERWAMRYNHAWNKIVEGWQRVLGHGPDGAVDAYLMAPNEGINASFQLGERTAWSRPSHDDGYFHRISR